MVQYFIIQINNYVFYCAIVYRNVKLSADTNIIHQSDTFTW